MFYQPGQTLHEYLGLNLQERSRKPRTKGITMVTAGGDGYAWDASLGALHSYHPYIDIIKATASELTQPMNVLRRKVDLWRSLDIRVQMGGVILEIARIQGREDEVLEKASNLGFNQVEISATSRERVLEEEADFAKKLKKYGFHVFGEVGKKFPKSDETRSGEGFEIQESVRQMKGLLAAGVEKVYWEGALLSQVIGSTGPEILKNARKTIGSLREIVSEIGIENIVFEIWPAGLPLAFWFVHLFGPDVNLGNGEMDIIGRIEHVRRGTFPVFGFEDLGNHPWIKSLMAGETFREEAWWTKGEESY